MHPPARPVVLGLALLLPRIALGGERGVDPHGAARTVRSL
jgi:hypothetical protein